jgi:DNA-directed RNA polymerase subunit RPC12/RpoP
MADEQGAKARCVSCRAEVLVPDQYAHGDHIACGTCGTKHKVVRGERVRLVMADAGPLRDALAQSEHAIQRIEADLAQARASFGIGANGFGIGVAFAIYQVGWNGEQLSLSLLGNALGIAIVSGLLLEAANWAFLAKRQRIARLTDELAEAEDEARQLRMKIRDATRL